MFGDDVDYELWTNSHWYFPVIRWGAAQHSLIKCSTVEGQVNGNFITKESWKFFRIQGDVYFFRREETNVFPDGVPFLTKFDSSKIGLPSRKHWFLLFNAVSKRWPLNALFRRPIHWKLFAPFGQSKAKDIKTCKKGKWTLIYNVVFSVKLSWLDF